MKDVKITLKTEYLLDGTFETFEYNGRLDTRNGCDYLQYEEENQKVKTIIKASANEAVISRSGEMKSTLKIIENGKISTVYQTPYGPFPMCVCGVTVENRLQDGILKLEYRLENGAILAHNKILITLKEV